MRTPILFAALFVPIILFAQTGVIRGRVIDTATQDPLVGANVVVEGTRFGDAVTSHGEFLIPGIPPGVYTLKASYVGYQTTRMPRVRVKAGDTTEVTFKLKAENVQYQAAEIAAEPLGGQRSLAKASMPPSPAMMGPPNWQPNTEEYAKYSDNPFLATIANPLSTFSIDVDVASYTNVRRFIESGTRPLADAVRTEEMVNYFTYDYPAPAGKDPFSINMELSDCPWSPKHHLLMIGLQGKKIPLENLPPCNLVFLIDVSGSMDMPNKLPLVQASLRLLVQQLRPVDQVAIVVYAGRAGMVLPPTHGDSKTAILNAIDSLSAGGSTAGGEGMQLAYRIAAENFLPKGNNRIVWATDGDFNVGVSSTSELVRFVEEKRKGGVYLSMLGFGMGNYKDSRLEELADKGNGNYAYIDNFTEARRVLVGQMAGTLFTIAKDVKIQVEFNPARVQAYRLIGYENRLLSKEDFNEDTKDAGELGSGHSVTAFYELVPPGVEIALPKVDSLKYQTPAQVPPASTSDELLTIKLRYKPPADTVSQLIVRTLNDTTTPLARTSDDFRFASSVAEFAMVLRDSPFKGNASFANLIERAKKSLGRDPEGYRSEFVRLATTAKTLVAPSAK